MSRRKEKDEHSRHLMVLVIPQIYCALGFLRITGQASSGSLTKLDVTNRNARKS